MMIRWLLVFCFIPVSAMAQWSNEPAGSVPFANCNMSDSSCGGRILNVYSSGTIISDGTDPLSPPGVADAALIYPNTVGGVQWNILNNSPKREMFVGMYFKVNSGYSCSVIGSSKTIFMRGFDAPFGQPTQNGVFLISGCGDEKEFSFSHNTGHHDNSHTCALDLGLRCYPNVGPSTFLRGDWVKFEACIRTSDTTTSTNGILRWWVNGQEAGRYLNLNYAGYVNEWVWSQTWDAFANGQGFTSDAHQYIGHVYISFPPAGGCGDLGPVAPLDTPAGAPATPTGFAHSGP